MSDPTDINDNDPTDDKNLSSLYHRASTEQPSKEVDDAILAKAQHAVEQSSGSSGYFPGWEQSFSIAAVLVLSMTIVLMIDKESPEVLEGSAPVVIKQKPPLEKDAMEQERETTGKHKNKELARPAGRLEEKRQAENNDIKTDLAKTPAKIKNSVAVLSEPVLNMPALRKTEPEKIKARKKLESPAIESNTESARFAMPAQAPRTMMRIMADRADEDAVNELSCQQLSEKPCLESAACTLNLNKTSKTYQCLPAKDHCELMFRQSEGLEETCESKQGCEFIPAQCYCPPGALCVCGGGEPPQCKSNNQE